MIPDRLARFLETSRDVRGLRPMRTTLRTAHIIAFAVLYGGHVYGLPAERLVPALAATVLTGGAFAALECYHAPIWLVQLRGVATVVKLVLVACVGLRWELRVLLLTVAIAIGSVASHMPGRFRYYSVLHGRQIGERESG
jgi:hypothetical protein